jgi:GNAT superfamily N-acetyltransferase
MIRHFRKQFISPPAAIEVSGIAIRRPEVPVDVNKWLKLREAAMAGQKPAVRAWNANDFAAEVTGKSWWRPERMWLAYELINPPALVGSVTLAMREGAAGSVPVVHWLLVHPSFRRRGVGRLLLRNLERAVWDAGLREVQAETHSNWEAAVAFYQSIGFASLRELER